MVCGCSPSMNFASCCGIGFAQGVQLAGAHLGGERHLAQQFLGALFPKGLHQQFVAHIPFRPGQDSPRS